MRISAVLLSLVMTFAPVATYAQSVPRGTTNIVPDGRTATSVTTNGSVSTVTTNTISGNNAFNSFSQFQVGRGATGNLVLPNGTSNLINLMSGNDPAVINGILNSYKNGQIGGNVYFASPKGFVVGRSGVVNVGSLHVTTPTREFVDSVISPSGQINQGAVNNLLAGTVPISPDGNIRIRGRINAVDAVRLTGQNVFVGSQRDAVNRDHAIKFASTVNSRGLRSANSIVVRNGSIQIVAADKARINGRLSANGRRGRDAGNIDIAAGGDITVTKNAKLSAKATGPAGNAGQIVVKAEKNLTVESGATFDVSSGNGDAGFIELSAKHVAAIANATYNFAAPNGKTGTLLIDPYDLVITGDPAHSASGPDNDYTVSTSIFSDGANVSLSADNSITIGSTGVIDTRKSGQTAGDITLKAPKITVLGQLLADTSTGATAAGAITLEATAREEINSGKAVADAEILINGVVKGGVIKMTADASALSDFKIGTEAWAIKAGIEAANPLGLDAGWVAAESTAKVVLGGSARVNGTSLEMTSKALTSATDPSVNVVAGSPVGATVVVGQVWGTSVVQIQKDAEVSVTGDLKLSASNNSTLKPSTLTISGVIGGVLGTKDQAAVASISYGSAEIQTSATIDAGAKIQHAGSVSVRAENTNDFNVEAKTYAFGPAQAGITLAIADISTSAVAHIAADLGSANDKVGSVLVYAGNNTTTNAASAAGTVGTGTLAAIFAATAALGDFYAGAPVAVSGVTAALVTKYLGKVNTGKNVPKLSAATAYIESDTTSSASIGADTGFAAPNVYSSGSVAVLSNIEDSGAKAVAKTSVNSKAKNPTASNPEATTAVSVAVSIGDFSHTSNAFIGSDVTVDASNIGVGARNNLPLNLTLSNWTSWDAIREGIADGDATLGIPGSMARASSAGTDFEFAGAVNYQTNETNTTAWVASDAKLTTRGSFDQWTPDPSFNFLGVLAVQAWSHIETLTLGGEISKSGGENAQPDAVGGAFNVMNSSTRTIAGIGDGAVIDIATPVNVVGVNVSARSEDLHIGVSPVSGRGTGLAGTGQYSALSIDNVTHASISNLATVTAPRIAIDATQQLQVYSITGTASQSAEVGVGISLAISQFAANTAAYVGDNHGDIGVDIDPGATGTGAQGTIKTLGLDITATTFGVDVAGAIAAEKMSDNENAQQKNAPPPGTPAKALALLGGAPESVQIGFAGSTAVIAHVLTTRAYVSGARIDPWQAVNSVTGAVNLNAVNNTLMVVLSGGAAINSETKTGPQKNFSAAMGAAIAVGTSENKTEAYIENSVLSKTQTVDVNAIAGGLEAIIGLGVALNSNADTTKAGSAAGSVSVAKVTDAVRAYIDNSSISGDPTFGLGDVTVSAYNSTNIGIGGGALYKGGTGGFGLAVTYGVVGDPSDGAATYAAITNSSVTNYADVTASASDPARIYVGAAMVGLSTPNGIGGTIVVSDIGRTTTAEVTDGTGSWTVRDALTVSSNDTRNATMEGLLGAYGTDPNGIPRGTDDAPPLDFSGADVTNLSDPGSSALGSGAAILTVAGVVQYSGGKATGTASIGLGLVDAYIHQKHIALVDQVVVDAANGNVAVTAQDSAAILSIGIGIGIQSQTKFAGQAALSVNRIDSEVRAQIGGDDATPQNTSINAQNVFVDAESGSVIRSVAATLAFGNQGAAGLSVAYNEIDGSVAAVVDGAKITTARDTRVTGQSDANILTISIGIADGNKVGLAGSTANNLMGMDVAAAIKGGSDVIAGGNVLVNASNNDTAAVIAGALGAGGSVAGIGISIVTNDISGDTAATISENSVVDARGAFAGIAVDSGKLASGYNVNQPDAPTVTPPDLAETQITVQGLAVVATSHQSIAANAVTLGISTGSASLGLAIVPVINTMGGTTTASIDGSQIDTRLLNGAARSDIQVIASSHSYSNDLVIGGSAGGVAGAAAVAYTGMSRATTASVTNSTVGTAPVGSASPQLRNVGITAEASQISSTIAVGLAVGAGGGAAGSGIINIFDADTSAYFVGGSLNAGSLAVGAHSANAYFGAAGAGAGGAGGAFAGAFVVGTSSNTTLAYVGDTSSTTTLTLDGRLSITAAGENEFNSYAIGAAAAGGVGVAGMIALTIIGNETRAGLYDTSVTQRATSTQTDLDASNNPVVNPAGIQIVATESIETTPIAGALGISTMATGIGAGANVVLMASKLTSEIVGGTINSPGTVLITSNSRKMVDALTITVGVGSTAGIGAAVGVVLLGTSIPTSALAELDAGGSGSLSAVNAMGTDNNFILSTAGLANAGLRTAAAASFAVATASDEQVQAYAKQQYLNLISNGSVQNGTFALNDSSIATFRAAATAKLGHAASDQEVRDYARTLYQDLAGGRTSYVLNDTAVPVYAQSLLSAGDYTTFQQLVANGGAKAGTFKLTDAGLAFYRPIVATALGIPLPTDQDVQNYAAAQYLALYHKIEVAADTQYANLLNGGTVSAGKFTLASANLTTYAQKALSSADYTSYQNLVTDGDIVNGIYTLKTAALDTYRAAAGDAFVTDTPTDQQVRDYAAAQYQHYVQATEAYAADQYQQYVLAKDNPAQPYSTNAALGNPRDAVIASISSATITASTVQVLSNATVSTQNFSTGVGIGIGGGVGAAVSYTRINDNVVASVDQSSIHTSNVAVTATMADGQESVAGDVTAAAGAGGLVAAVGAAVAYVEMTNAVTAALGGTIGGIGSGAAPVIAVSASDTSGMRSDAYGAAVGGGLALGVSLAYATKESTIGAGILDGASITASSVNVTASNAGAVYAYALAGAGGLILAGTGAEADASDAASVTAKVGAATIILGSGDITISATDTPDAKAMALGVTVSGVGAVGVSLAHADVTSTVLAQVERGASITTTGDLSVTAASVYAGAGTGQPTNSFPVTGLPPGDDVPASTDNFEIGGTSAATWAIAGAGAIFLSATGVSALSENHASVIAQIGDTDPVTGEVVGAGFVLPNGNVIITANNVSNQVSRGIGITVGGLLAIGTVQSRSTADTQTAALIGSYVGSSAMRSADVTVTGTSYDNNSAKAQAGSGGLLAGSGAEATTSGTAKVTAAIGAGSGIVAGDIAINASHTVGFFASVDSLSAAALGASASLARNEFTSDVTASIGDGAGLVASGGLTATASNTFTRIGTDISANAAAGGGINGAGASSQTDITGNTHVLFGANVMVSTGADGITALAYSILNFADYVSLNTGGVIQGAGVESKLFATFNNDVTVADSQANAIGQFVTQGAINFGTFAQANAVSNATVSTYGLASVGDAVSEIDLKVNQKAIIGTNNTLLAVGNVSITPGLDPTLFRSTNLTINAGAYGYIYGIIAIPGAFASASAASDAAVEIRNGAKVQSAGNIEIGAYHGTPNASATGKGKGYALYFIPIEIDDASVSRPVTGTVTIDGTVTAGLYHEQEILITCGQGVTCGPNSVAKLQLLKGAPVIVNGVTLQALPGPSATVNSQSFNAAGYVSANFDPEVAPVMLLGVSANPVQAFMIGSMFAAGGNVTINADVIKGAGVVTALGAPTITLTNNSNAYIVLSQAYIPDTPGGRILFTGTAQQADAPASLQLVGDNRTGGYDISVAMNYTGAAIGPAGPAFINSGNIVNLGGSINMTNATGWFGQLGDVMGRSVSEYAPNGGLVVSAVNPGQMFSAGSFPYSDWVNFMNFPGSDAGSAPALLNSTEQAAAAMWVAAYVANLYALGLPSRIDDPSLLNDTWFPTDAQSLFSLKLFGMAGNMVSYIRGIQGIGVPLTDLTSNNNNVSHVFFGSCGWSAGGRCGDANFAGGLSPAGFAYMLNGNSTGDEIWQPVVPLILSRGGDSNILHISSASNGFQLTSNSYSAANIANSAPKTFGTPGLIKAFGGPVAIKANIININGTIETGRPNSWSVELPQSLMATATTSQVFDHYNVAFKIVNYLPVLEITPVYRTEISGGGEIARFQAQYDLGQQSLAGAHNATAYEALGPVLTLQTTTTANGSDKKVDVTYNAVTKTITTSDVNASSGGGFVLLDGKIINTGPTANAMINVNGGLGQVGIDNQTGLAMAISDVNNGSTVDGQPIVSTVRIVDRLQPVATNTTTYYFTPGVGMTVYKTSNGAVPVAGVTPIYAQTGSASAQYVPVEGARFQWQQQTQIQRDIIWGTNTDGSSNGLIDDITPWRFKSLQAGGNPWYFVAANGSLVGNDQAQGSVFIDVASKNIAFKETMSAQITDRYTLFHGYGGCNGAGSICNYGFRESTNYQFPNPGFASWFYDYILGAKLTLTSSVKADNPFGINFFGNATASLNITSNAALSLNGNITNPSGKTTIAVTNGGLTQAPTSVFQTGDLVITAAGGIGTASQAVTAIMSSGAAVRTQSGTQSPAGGVASANNTYLKFNSGALIDKVAAGTAQTGYADVSISAVGDLERATRHADGSVMSANDVNLSGSNITLSSQFGSVGTGADPLVMSANYTANASGSLTGGVVTVSAVGDVGLTQAGGFNAPSQVDLRVGSITTAGDVYLKIINGTLVDASGKTGSSTLSDTQVAANSQRLHLTLADGATQNAIDTGITSFENLYNRSYTSYFGLTANGAVSGAAQIDPADLAATVSVYRPLAEAAQVEAARQQGQNFAGSALTVLTDAQVLAYAAALNAKNGVFVLDAAKIALYRPLAAAALKIAAPTDAQVQAYANAQYQTYATVFERGSGANWSSQAQFASQQPAFAFHVDPVSSLAQSLTSGSVWDPKQLIAAINQTPIAVGNTAATVAGHRISVEAIGGGIGQTAAPVSITLDDLRAGTLTSEQKKALAGAAPGAVVAVAADGTEYPTDNLPVGIAITSIRISQAAPVFVSASSTVSGKSDTDIYMQATGTPFAAGQMLRIGSMSAPGNINLVAGSGIVASTEPTAAAARIIAGGDLSLLTDSAGSGSIGDENTPLTYSAGGRLVAAVAGKDIYLTAISDTTLGRLQAGDTLSIETTAGGIFSYLTNIAISGKNVILNSAGDIGDSSKPLLVQVSATGELNGSAAGAAYIYGPTLATDAAPRALHVGTFSANGPIALTSDFDLTVQSVTSANGDITIGSGAKATVVSATVSALTGTGAITVTAIDDLEVGTLTAPGRVSAQAGGTAAVTANGVVTSQTDGVEIVGAAVAMQTGSAITADKTVSVIAQTGDAAAGQLTSANGEITVTAAGKATIAEATVQGGTGGITANAGTDLEVGTLTAPGRVSAQAGGTAAVTANGVVTSQTDGVEIVGAAVAMQTGSAVTADKTVSVIAQTGDAAAGQLTSANGDISVVAAGKATIAGATVQGGTGGITANAGTDLDVGSLTAPGRVSAQAGGAMTVGLGKAITSLSDAIDVAANSLAMQANSLMSAAKTIAVATLGDAIVGKLISAFAPSSNNTTAISVAAGDATHAGQIQGNGDGQVNFTVTRPNSAVVLAASNGMGTENQPLTVDTPWLSASAAQGDIHIKSLGDIHVTRVSVPQGKLDLTTTGAITFDEVKGNDIVLQSNGKLDVGNVEVTSSVQLIGTEIVGTIVQTPGSPGPLSVSIMGPNGTLAQNAVVVIDPPATVIPQLLAVDATITNIGPSFTVQYGYIAGRFTLFMNGQSFVMNNRSPTPLGGFDVQLYQQGSPFYFSQNGIRTYTSGYVVNYGLGVDPTALSLFNGMSFTRDVPRDMWNGSPFDDDDDGSKKPSQLRKTGLSPQAMLEGFRLPKAVETVGSGPAVNIKGLQ